MIAVAYHYIRNECNLYKGIHPTDWYTFKKQIRYLLETNSTITFKEDLDFFIESYKSSLDKKKYIITFDDGLKEHFQASKLLAENGIRSIFSIIGCTTVEGKIPLVHKLHWLRSTLEFNFLKNELEKLLGRTLISNKDIIEKAKKMHIQDDIETAVFKYNLNFLLDFNELDHATSKLILKYIPSERSFCESYFLTMDEIIEMQNLGHIIAWHTKYHIPMSKLSSQEIEEDLNYGYNLLNEIYKQKNNEMHICYPYGRLDALPLNHLDRIMLKKFKYGWTLDNLESENIDNKYNDLLLQRITTNELFKNTDDLSL